MNIHTGQFYFNDANLKSAGIMLNIFLKTQPFSTPEERYVDVIQISQRATVAVS
jgi:hypothetical protein